MSANQVPYFVYGLDRSNWTSWYTTSIIHALLMTIKECPDSRKDSLFFMLDLDIKPEQITEDDITLAHEIIKTIDQIKNIKLMQKIINKLEDRYPDIKHPGYD